MAGQADPDWGSGFDDDDLDGLPLAALDELENNAIRLTQAALAAPQVPREALPSSDYGESFDDEDLDDAVVIDEARSAPPVRPTLHRPILSQTSQRENQYLRPQLGATRNTNWVRQNPALHQPNRDRLPTAVGGRSIPPAQVLAQAQAPAHTQETDEASTLRRQLEELKKELADVKHDNYVRVGEIATVRSQLERQAKERERDRAALQKSTEEQLEKQRRELQAAQTAAQAAVTERDFMRQDLREVQRAQNLNKAAEKRDVGLMTPKKKKTLSHRDGFDDDEVDLVSPSKLSPSKFQKRMGTPSKAGKRKRKTLDSPIAPLEVIHAEELIERPETKDPAPSAAILPPQDEQDDRFDFLSTMLDHSPSHGHARTIEELGRHTLPSTPKETFESIILSKIPTMGRPTKDLPVEFCELLVSLWRKCFDEKYYVPIYLFIDMLTLALEMRTLSIAPHIIDDLVPLAQLTADLVAIPRFSTESTAKYDKDINPSACLAILHIAALGCVTEASHIRRFWRQMRWDFVLLILSINQPTEDFNMMLKILSTSIFRDTFGMIVPDPSRQLQYSGYIVDRLTYPLFEIPLMPTGTDKIPPDTLLRLRIDILQLLMSMTCSPFASAVLANHHNAVGRLVSLMSEELDVLYDYRAGHESSSLILTLATRILYYLVTTYELDMPAKLAPIHGGAQKYLLVLSRLNFAEDDLLLESGIGMDVQGLALEMLNLKVTPAEVDEVNGAFAGCLRE